jgi:hypothetical protein
MRNRTARIGATLALAHALLWSGAAPEAFAQKPTKPPVGAAASTSGVTPPATPAPAPAPEVPATDSAPATTLTATTEVTPKASAPASDEFDVTEKDGQRYYFIGLRYQGTVVPQAFMNLFVGGGATVWSNAVTLQGDIRKDGFSMIPGITYASLSSGDMLFLQHGKPEQDEGNWSLVNSGIKVLYLDVDLLWSVHLAKNFDFEYGAGFGVGFVFGSLEDNWVTATAPNGQPATANTPGAIAASGAAGGDKRYFVACQKQSQGSGCMLGDHSGSTTAKVGNYQEPSWANGGSKPNLFPYISFPQIGLRIKPMKSFEGRLGVGFSLTGPWFGFSGFYGLEKALEKK